MMVSREEQESIKKEALAGLIWNAQVALIQKWSALHKARLQLAAVGVEKQLSNTTRLTDSEKKRRDHLLERVGGLDSEAEPIELRLGRLNFLWKDANQA